jgi:hypothetical protein
MGKKDAKFLSANHKDRRDNPQVSPGLLERIDQPLHGDGAMRGMTWATLLKGYGSCST